jgi:hypothetical protein
MSRLQTGPGSRTERHRKTQARTRTRRPANQAGWHTYHRPRRTRRPANRLLIRGQHVRVTARRSGERQCQKLPPVKGFEMALFHVLNGGPRRQGVSIAGGQSMRFPPPMSPEIFCQEGGCLGRIARNLPCMHYFGLPRDRTDTREWRGPENGNGNASP